MLKTAPKPGVSDAYILTAGGVVTDATAARNLTAADNGKVIY